jgi:two-component system, NarL family, response regulator NreC
MKPFCVILADDHAMFRQGVRRILEELPGVEVVGEAQDGLALLDLLKSIKPHLIILDISMPNLRGMEAAWEIKALQPGVKILMLTMHKEREYLYYAMKAGVDGFLLKEDADSELLLALEGIRQGKVYISPLLAEQLPDLLAQQYGKGGDHEFSQPLTEREKQILTLIAEGKSSKQIGSLLFISPRTVQNHRANIMKKLNFKKSADLVKYAIQKGFA